MTILSGQLEEHAGQIRILQQKMNIGERYTEADARRDFSYANERMARIESSDAECARRINEHIRGHPSNQ